MQPDAISGITLAAVVAERDALKRELEWTRQCRTMPHPQSLIPWGPRAKFPTCPIKKRGGGR
jgi:hypothetical protein